MSAKVSTFATEAELVAAFCAGLPKRQGWIAYHETAGWDLLLVSKDGIQVGIEAKLSLNAKVLEQALPGRWVETQGPDYRAVLVPSLGLQCHLSRLASHVGITVISMPEPQRFITHYLQSLPDESCSFDYTGWHNWAPIKRCALPDYIPDVTGGKAAPVQLSPWKIKAIKLMILLERRGSVNRADMKALQISPSRWTDAYNGFLKHSPEGGYIRCDRTPDFRAQHPENWAQIEADFPTWSKGHQVASLLVAA